MDLRSNWSSPIKSAKNGFVIKLSHLIQRTYFAPPEGQPTKTRLRGNPTAVLVHSDRGVQYASADYRAALTRAGHTPSLSRKGNCYDNAARESLWSSLKLELIYRTHFSSRSAATATIFDYIEIFYKRERSYSSLGFLYPSHFEALKS